jgi:hypothetical protein
MNKMHLRQNSPTNLTPPTNRPEERNYYKVLSYCWKQASE